MSQPNSCSGKFYDILEDLARKCHRISGPIADEIPEEGGGRELAKHEGLAPPSRLAAFFKLLFNLLEDVGIISQHALHHILPCNITGREVRYSLLEK